MPATAASQQHQVSFSTTTHEFEIAEECARRAMSLERRHGGRPRDFMEWVMDLTATHANGNPLDFDKLLLADDFNFMHDVFGIARHLDRNTGKLGDCFSPRCSAREAV